MFFDSVGWHVYDIGKASVEGRKVRVLIPISRMAVRSNNNMIGHTLDLSSFRLKEKWVSVAQSEQQVERQPTVEFVDDDDGLTGVSTPPVRSLFPIGVRISSHGISGLSGPSRSNQ